MIVQVAHPAFVHQANGIVYVSDGLVEASFTTVSDFLIAEPEYQLPEGIISLNYEIRGTRILYILTGADGKVVHRNDANAVLESYIAKAFKYRTIADSCAHPLYNVTDDRAARIIAKRMIAQEFERRTNDLLSEYSFGERLSWLVQIAEAQHVLPGWPHDLTQDSEAVAPFLDAIMVPGETRSEVAASILAKNKLLFDAMAPLLQRKRMLIDAVDTAELSGLRCYDAKMKWDESIDSLTPIPREKKTKKSLKPKK